jgi:uncharacterized repeat protein (TIGR03803 family)
MILAKRLTGLLVLSLLLLVVPEISPAQTGDADGSNVEFTTLARFTGANGLAVTQPLVQASNGDLYGTSNFGGSGTYCGNMGCGTIFGITPGGTLTTLYSFLCSQSGCTNGAFPNSALVQSENGALYGTTQGGGPGNVGTMFKITPSGVLTTLYSFCAESGCPDGDMPFGGIVQAANGDFYGTTPNGGVSGNGTIFKVTPSGTLTTLYSFCSQNACADGQNPNGSLIQATNGDLFGTTTFGGTHNGPFCPSGCGTIFKVTPNGALTTLYSFCSLAECSDGFNPNGLVQRGSGNFYGTTANGGIANSSSPSGSGTIFKITAHGTLTTLYSFCSQPPCPDGNTPQAGLVVAANGSLYGTTSTGGSNRYGTIFKITPLGTLTTLYNFCSLAGCADGANPNGLVQSTSGTFYGTTDGPGGYGTVFALKTGEAPFVETRPTIGVAGELVTIVGYGMKGATSVTFDGTPATILYDAPTVIYAIVPTHARTGKVQVVTPSGTLTSKVAFEVL